MRIGEGKSYNEIKDELLNASNFMKNKSPETEEISYVNNNFNINYINSNHDKSVNKSHQIISKFNTLKDNNNFCITIVNDV